MDALIITLLTLGAGFFFGRGYEREVQRRKTLQRFRARKDLLRESGALTPSEGGR